MTDNEDLVVLGRALDQLSDLLTGIPPEASSGPTPCGTWTVQDLVDHIVAAPMRFSRMVRGQAIDWSAPTPPAGPDPADAFRAHGEDLLRAWRANAGAVEAPGPDWQCAELAVHTWDLAAALNVSTDGLDPQVAERGLDFLRANLTAENRGPAFGPPQPAPERADAYQRIAAFAGRTV